MKKSRMLLVGITAAFLAMVIGVGFALVQDQPLGQAANGEFQGPGPRGRHLAAGEVVSIENGTITISTKDGDKQVKLPAITTGMRIAVVTAEDGTLHAVIYNPPELPAAEPAPEDAAGSSTMEGTSVS
ncbi:MAG: hypothetical protein ACYC4D_05065 [Thermoleophilia bacterium]